MGCDRTKFEIRYIIIGKNNSHVSIFSVCTRSYVDSTRWVCARLTRTTTTHSLFSKQQQNSHPTMADLPPSVLGDGIIPFWNEPQKSIGQVQNIRGTLFDCCLLVSIVEKEDFGIGLVRSMRWSVCFAFLLCFVALQLPMLCSYFISLFLLYFTILFCFCWCCSRLRRWFFLPSIVLCCVAVVRSFFSCCSRVHFLSTTQRLILPCTYTKSWPKLQRAIFIAYIT